MKSNLLIESMHVQSKYQQHYLQKYKQILKLEQTPNRPSIATVILSKTYIAEGSQYLTSKYTKYKAIANNPV
jgi:hypothetical protein